VKKIEKRAKKPLFRPGKKIPNMLLDYLLLRNCFKTPGQAEWLEF